jgi:hypothetical protein
MTLDFAQLAEQVQRMGQELDAQQLALEDRVKIALGWLREWSERQDEMWARVELAGEVQAKYRGASPIGNYPGAPSEQGPKEPMAEAVELTDCPEQATLIAVDGSQIYLDPQSDVHYYLLNTGVFVTHHGTDTPPKYSLHPKLFYKQEDIYIEDGQRIHNAVIGARRTIEEREQLAAFAKQYADEDRPLLAVADGPLLFWVGSEMPSGSQKVEDDILQKYLAALTNLRDAAQAAPAGYVDKPASTYVIRLLHLLSLDEDKVSNKALATNGEIEGVYDRMLFAKILGSGERSALFVQRSPYNKRYVQKDPDLEIAFFYMNTSLPGERPYLARVEVPMWVARDRELVGQVQALLYHQCTLYGRYPYMLARADELAVVQGQEKRELDSMIDVALRRYGRHPQQAVKPASKQVARGRQRQRHR